MEARGARLHKTFTRHVRSDKIFRTKRFQLHEGQVT